MIAFARAFSRCALRPALARCVPVYALAVIATGAPIGAFARSGALTAEPFVMPALAAAWVIALSRVRAPLFDAPETEDLRTIAVARPLPRRRVRCRAGAAGVHAAVRAGAAA